MGKAPHVLLSCGLCNALFELLRSPVGGLRCHLHVDAVWPVQDDPTVLSRLLRGFVTYFVSIDEGWRRPPRIPSVAAQHLIGSVHEPSCLGDALAQTLLAFFDLGRPTFATYGSVTAFGQDVRNTPEAGSRPV
jgi:hypothetical protein